MDSLRAGFLLISLAYPAPRSLDLSVSRAAPGVEAFCAGFLYGVYIGERLNSVAFRWLPFLESRHTHTARTSYSMKPGSRTMYKLVWPIEIVRCLLESRGSAVQILSPREKEQGRQVTKVDQSWSEIRFFSPNFFLSDQ